MEAENFQTTEVFLRIRTHKVVFPSVSHHDGGKTSESPWSHQTLVYVAGCSRSSSQVHLEVTSCLSLLAPGAKVQPLSLKDQDPGG